MYVTSPKTTTDGAERAEKVEKSADYIPQQKLA
jgi:hypothetical protein